MSISPKAFLHLLEPPASPLLPLPVQQCWQWLHQGRLLPLVKLVLNLLLQLIPHLPIIALMEAVHLASSVQGLDDVAVVDEASVGQDGAEGEGGQCLALGPQQEHVAGRQLGQW